MQQFGQQIKSEKSWSSCRISWTVVWSLTETRLLCDSSLLVSVSLLTLFLQICLELFKTEFIEIATKLSAVVACRCSPTQKADVARLIRHHTRKRVCCIGDGGNDVSMIQAADVGAYALIQPLRHFQSHSFLFSRLRCRYRRQGRCSSFSCRRLLCPSICLSLPSPSMARS